MGLLAEAQPSGWVECDACFEGHQEEVEWVESPAGSQRRGYIVCPEHGLIRVEPERLRRWRFRCERLAELIATGQGAGGARELVRGRVWSLGRVHLESGSYDLCLGLGLGWSDGLRVMASATTSASLPVLWLSVHGRTGVDGSRIEHLATVADLIHWEADRLTVDVGQLIGKAPPAPLPTPNSQYVFRRIGDRWHIRYETEETYLNHTKGVEYVWWLLSNPRQQLHVARLTALVEGHSAADSPLTREDVRSQGLRMVANRGRKRKRGPADPVALFARYEELRRKDEDQTASDAELAEMNRLLEQIDEVTDRTAGGDGNADPGELARSNVSHAIGNTIGRISRSMEKCATHLRTGIKRGFFCSYSPEQEVHWLTQ